MVGGRIGEEFEDRERGRRFAGAGLANQRRALALDDIEGNAVDRDRLAAAGAEGDGKIADGEANVLAHANVFRGSNASRIASPMKIRSESMTATAKKPVRPSHGACTFALPWERSSPSDAEP